MRSRAKRTRCPRRRRRSSIPRSDRASAATRRREHAGAAVDRRVEDDGGDDVGDREGQQREQLAAQTAHAEHHGADDDPEERGHEPRGKQRPHKRHFVARGEHRGRVGARAVKRAVPEGEISRVAAEHVPRGGERDPEEHEIQERLDVRRRPERGQRGEGRRDADEGRNPVLPAHVECADVRCGPAAAPAPGSAR